MQNSRRVLTPQRIAVNGSGTGCCEPACSNPFDLAIIAVADELTDVQPSATYQLRTQGFPGFVVGIRVLNQGGEIDVTSLAGFGQRAQGTLVGSGNVNNGNLPQLVDAATWNTTACLCQVSLGCINSTVGPSLSIQRSPAVSGALDAKLHVHDTNQVTVRINFYVCYSEDAINDPSTMCNVGFQP